MRYLSVFVLAVVVALSTLDCAKAPPTLSPAGARAFQLTRVVKGLDAFRDVAVAAADQSPPLVRRVAADRIVDFHHATIVTIGASGPGTPWPVTARTALDALTGTLTSDEAKILGPYLALVKAVLQGVQ